MNFMELKYVVTIDFVHNNQGYCRQDVVGLEDENNLKNFLQTCLEFVIKNENAQFEMAYFKDRRELSYTLNHKKSWVFDDEEKDKVDFNEKNAYSCQRVTLENIKENSKLYCSIYEFDNSNMNWFSEFSNDVLKEKVAPSSLASQHFKEVLEEREIDKDKTNLKNITKVDYPSKKKKVEKVDLSVTDYCCELFNALKQEPEGTTTHFKFIQYPLFETNRPSKSITQYWLVTDKSAGK